MPALVLGIGLFALPVRFWVVDGLVGAAVAAVAAASVIALVRPAWARRALRVGAASLLGVGLFLIAAAVLSAAFLSGIHGDYGQGGMLLMSLIAFMLLPYAIVYPVLELLWLHARSVRA